MSGQTLEVKKGNGRTGYRKPDAKRDRLSFKLSQDQLDMVQRHAFDEDELPSELVHRLLERLVAEDLHPTGVLVDLYPRVTPSFSLRINPKVSELVQLYWQGSNQATADLLITFAASLDPVGAVTSPHQAFQLLQIFSGRRVPVDTAIANLLQRCSRATTLRLLDELIECKRIRAIDVQGRCPHKRIELPSGRRLAYIELPQAI